MAEFAAGLMRVTLGIGRDKVRNGPDYSVRLPSRIAYNRISRALAIRFETPARDLIAMASPRTLTKGVNICPYPSMMVRFQVASLENAIARYMATGVSPGPLGARCQPRQTTTVGVGGDQAPAIVHRRRQRERLAPRPGAQIEHRFARARGYRQTAQLRAAVLHFDGHGALAGAAARRKIHADLRGFGIRLNGVQQNFREGDRKSTRLNSSHT